MPLELEASYHSCTWLDMEAFVQQGQNDPSKTGDSSYPLISPEVHKVPCPLFADVRPVAM